MENKQQSVREGGAGPGLGNWGRSVSLRGGGVPGADCSLEELLSGQSGQSLLACLAQSVA